MAIYSKLIEGLNNGDEMFVKVFTINPKGRVNNRVDLPFASVIPSAFPHEPSSYELINTYTTATTFTAPENGYYRIELFGASGNGGNGGWSSNNSGGAAGGGGGGGGAVAISEVKLNKGDTVILTSIAIGSTAATYINSSIEVYSNMLCVSGANGGNSTMNRNTSPSTTAGGKGGSGGSASGGNVGNYNGGAGGTGASLVRSHQSTLTASGGGGGSAGYTGGNVGGDGGKGTFNADYASGSTTSPGSGKTAFMKIYRGNTNLA